MYSRKVLMVDQQLVNRFHACYTDKLNKYLASGLYKNEEHYEIEICYKNDFEQAYNFQGLQGHAKDVKNTQRSFWGK